MRPEGGGLRYRARPRHRLRVERAARPDAASQPEWEAMLEAASCWRDRFLLVLLWFGGLRIGEALGGRDHSTILHGCEKIEREMGENDDFRRDINSLRELLYAE